MVQDVVARTLRLNVHTGFCGLVKKLSLGKMLQTQS